MADFDWSEIRMVVFDVDGTLYSQRAIRVQMAIKLIGQTIRAASFRPLRIIKFYRHCREEIGDAEIENFEEVLVERTAQACGVSAQEVRRIVEEWIEQQPLPLLRAARYPHLDRVFAALRRRGIVVGVLSDYPAVEKLKAMELTADHVIWAGEPAIQVLKPNPRGLQAIMDVAGVTPEQTLMVGDRDERDGAIARRLGVRALIRSRKPIPDRNSFPSYDSAPFSALLG